jgi:glycine dehydrogenase subunit 1
LLGNAGLFQMEKLSHTRAVATARRLEQIAGVSVINAVWFNEFAVQLPRAAAPVVEALAARGVLGGVPLSRLCPDRPDLANVLLIATSECTDPADIATLAETLAEVLA